MDLNSFFFGGGGGGGGWEGEGGGGGRERGEGEGGLAAWSTEIRTSELAKMCARKLLW